MSSNDDRGMPERPRFPVGDAADDLVPPEEREREHREMDDPAPAPGERNIQPAGGSGGDGDGSRDGSSGGGSGDGSGGGGGGDGDGSGGGGGGGGGDGAAMGGEDGGTEHNLAPHFGGVPSLHSRSLGDRLGGLVDRSRPSHPHVDPRVTDPTPE